MIDLNLDIEISNNDIKILSSLRDSLLPIELVVKSLCQRDATLLSANAVVDFAINELRVLGEDNQYALKLCQCLQNRVAQRERSDLLLVLRFLQTGKTHSSTDFNAVKYTLVHICKKLHLLTVSGTSGNDVDDVKSKHADNEDAGDSGSTSNDNISEPKASMSNRLQSVLRASKEQPLFTQDSANDSAEFVIGREMDIFRTTFQKGALLQKLQNALNSIPPTSVEAERAFSAAGNFVNKLRTRLSDKTLSKICMLRQHFLSQK
jgi:hypothetical protein